MLPFDTPPKNICIVRLSALGDVTHAVPVLRAIQKNWPLTRVTWICATAVHPLLSVLDGVRFIVIDKKAGWRGYRQLRRDLGGERFDIMLQMQTSARANFTGACVKADIKLGWDKIRARDFHRFFMTHFIPETKHQHQVQGHLSFARTIGLDVSEPEWNFPVSEEAIKFVNALIPAGKRILLISPCSSHKSLNWCVDRYTGVAKYVSDQHATTVVLTGGRSDLELSIGEAIENSMNKQVINLIGKLSLPQLMALLKRADVALTPDSGPAHMANAVGTPVIVLHACTWSRRSGPYNSLDLCVDKFAEAARRFRGKKPENLRWGTRIRDDGVMNLIEIDDVIERINLAIERIDAR